MARTILSSLPSSTTFKIRMLHIVFTILLIVKVLNTPSTKPLSVQCL